MTDPKDTYTSFGAGLLAKTIETYWHDRGYLNVRVERYELGANFPGMWGVRSNLVAGMPSKGDGLWHGWPPRIEGDDGMGFG